MRFILALLLFLSLLTGCSSGPPLPADLPYEIINWGDKKFEKTKSNRYAIFMRSHLFDKQDNYLSDPFIVNDLEQLAKLLCHKKYDIWYVSNAAELYKVLAKIAVVSDKNTKLFLAYTGKGDVKGLRLFGKYVTESQMIIPPDGTVYPKELLSSLSKVSGSQAVLLNACESGVFVDEADKLKVQGKPFGGVIIASCGTGYLTTPYERMDMSATYATFIEHYVDNLDIEIDLNNIEIDYVGGWWYNFIHIVSHKIDRLTNRSLKPISYNAVVYRGGSFKL